jgi:hypothetical protein
MGRIEYKYIIQDSKKGFIEEDIYEEDLKLSTGDHIILDTFGPTYYLIDRIDKVFEFSKNRVTFVLFTHEVEAKELDSII